MKKLILGFTLIANCISGLTYAQSGVVIQHDGAGPNLAGGAYETTMYANHPDLVAGGGTLDIHFTVTNNTGADHQWRITRKKISVPASWSDQVCWPPSCYPASGDLYTTPSTGGNPAPIILDGTSTAQTTSGNVLAEMKPRITPDALVNSYAHYRYYIYEGGVYVDSVDIKINYTLGVNQLKQNNALTISPNPADDNVNINIGAMENASVKVVDVLGNVVMTESIANGTKNLDVTGFKNGVYFVIVEANGVKPVNRKLIVRH